MKNISRRIKSIREEKGITQAELADNLHLALDTLIKFEEGILKLSPEHISEFATALEVSEEYLKRGELHENTAVDIRDALLDNSPVTTSHSTTNNYYGGDNQNPSDLERFHPQLDRIEQKLDFLLQALFKK